MFANIQYQDLLIQLTIFIATYLVMTKFVFKPFLNQIALREQETTGKSELASKNFDEASSLDSDAQTTLQTAKKAASNDNQGVVDQASKAAGEKLTKARSDAQNIFQNKRDELASKEQDTLNSLQKEVEKVSNEMVQTILS